MGTKRFWIRVEAIAARLVMILVAIGIALAGVTLLTTPWAIPVTVLLWLGAAAIVGLGVFGTLPSHGV